jgi:RNA polymerase sigma factor (sigma-70 family)
MISHDQVLIINVASYPRSDPRKAGYHALSLWLPAWYQAQERRGDIGGKAHVRRAIPSRKSPGGSGLSDADREDLVRSHLPLVRAVARRQAGAGEQFDDAVQAGSLALVKASVRFDPSRGVAFATFVTPAVEGAIRRQLRERSPGVRLPDTVDVERPGEPDPLAEIDQRVLLADGLRALDERERRIVVLRFHADLTEREIAREVGISQAHVSRLLDGALAKLRAQFPSADPGITKTDAISLPKSPEIAEKRTKIPGVGAHQEGVGARPDGDAGKTGADRSRSTKSGPSYSGRFLVRMPGELHEQLALAAERREVSLNRYVNETLSSSVGSTPADGDAAHTRSKLRMALAANVVIVVLAAGAAIVLLVLALERGI